MSNPVAYGIDFGTTNSSIAVAYEDGVEVLPINPDSPMPACLPSMTYLDRNNTKETGKEALDLFTVTGGQQTQCSSCDLVRLTNFGPESDCKQFQPQGKCLDSRLISELKTALTSDRESTHSWAKDYELAYLASIVIERLKAIADKHTGQDIRKAVIGHPVDFVGAKGSKKEEQNKLAVDRLREAAHRAGFDEVEMYSEPAAAALGKALEDGLTVVVDFGGGTFDTAVVHSHNGKQQYFTQGAPIGGALFDAYIFDYKLAKVLGLHSLIGPRSLPVPNYFKENLRSLGRFKFLLTDARTPGIVDNIRGVNDSAGRILDDIIDGGHAGPFYSAIESAKISLTENSLTYINFHSPDSDINIPLHRDEFNEWIDTDLKTVKDTINKAIEKAHKALKRDNIRTKDIRRVIRTGGSSNLGAFVDMLTDMYGTEKNISSDAFTSVAYGLAVHAQKIWKSAS